MSVYPIVLSQDSFSHRENLTFPFEERGSQFGDGVYEVIRIYQGQYYLLEEHIERLFRSLREIRIDLPYTEEQVTAMLQDLIKRNKMNTDGKVYLQVTRGSARRDHIFPDDTTPNFYAYIEDVTRRTEDMIHGVHTMTRPDERWLNCHIKSLNLLPNLLAKQEAHEAGCYEAILHRDHKVTECSTANVYLVKDGKVYTHKADNYILFGCVRIAVERFAKDLNIPFIEEAFTTEAIAEADEMFLSSSTAEIVPIIKVDNQLIKDGKPGEITRKLQEAYAKDAGITPLQELVNVSTIKK